ncbi:phosphoenolpyruvate carboxylase [Nonlabens ulvanivorans]|uniref:Phosphoenolpyruvate carboxylase n=1 Tax=Nonlabens ulvanivorans TaxID=906888 RepID=A0A084K0B4_NONUL|nr:phosphoenolpyruvate carboxylase [Nonlabens ulvanivorans]KEZ94648.1 phosphoenolpyruvate carboxylase [Nonlabens ulvanivorans]PRX12564.1 phosphoenolpyruvate carboxylase type 1 [Nonlabens ulvanivorans]
MQDQDRIAEFKKSVQNKFNIYNSLFLNLPYSNIENVGMLIPLLMEQSQKGLKEGLNPKEIIEAFFNGFADLHTEQDRIDFMFRIIQYVERQVVLYDSVEDAAFPKLQQHSSSLSLKDYFQIVEKNNSWDAIEKQLNNFSARIVLTAHPTQFYTPAVLDIITNLRTLINDNNIDEIDVALQQLGLTSLVNSKKPTPLDEAKNIIHTLRHVYYDAIGEMYTHIKSSVGNAQFDNHDIVKLGFWPGGDRDGNPFVTASITKEVMNELRVTLMKCYYNELKELQRKLSFKEILEPITNLRNTLYEAMFDATVHVAYQDIIEPLIQIRQLLVANYHGLYLKDLDLFIDKVKIFKTHFATIDIRQDHSMHTVVMQAVLKKYGYIKESIEELTQQQLIDILLQESISLDPNDYEEDIVKDTIVNISQLSTIQENNGEQGCNRYIISNSEDVYSVLYVFALFRWCGWENRDITFDIIPLFETMKGMDDSRATMEQLFELEAYRKHVAFRNHKQTIMLGFSDGTKDGGYLKANWSILKTKESLSEVCSQHDVAAIFFDGRGGPPARGGGKTHRFYAAQTSKVANNEIQLTIQGQTITSTYGTKEQFKHNSEQLLTAGLSNSILDKEITISQDSRSLIEELSELSFKKYDALKHHDKFMPYLENMSTLKYYTKANIGSRPGKRGHKAKLELTDLRAISFVGSWSQLKQNVPGYFGIGTALQTMQQQGRFDEVKQLYNDVPFFKALMLNSMMSLSKCYFELTSYMKENEEYGAFWQILEDEYLLSKRMLLELSGMEILMEKETISRESIKIRENIVLPLLVIQQYALQMIAQHNEHQPEYEKIVTRSLYGNINASRNSA